MPTVKPNGSHQRFCPAFVLYRSLSCWRANGTRVANKLRRRFQALASLDFGVIASNLTQVLGEALWPKPDKVLAADCLRRGHYGNVSF